jgi:hypothetical protein
MNSFDVDVYDSTNTSDIKLLVSTNPLEITHNDVIAVSAIYYGSINDATYRTLIYVVSMIAIAFPLWVIVMVIIVKKIEKDFRSIILITPPVETKRSI